MKDLLHPSRKGRGEKIRVVHLINSLIYGGAEIILKNLLRFSTREVFENQVFTLHDFGPVGEEIRKGGWKTVDLGMRNKLALFSLLPLFRALGRNEVDILHCHSFHSNFLGALMGRLKKTPAVIASQYNITPRHLKYRAFFNRMTARLATLFIANSERVKRHLVDGEGIPERKVRRVYLGVDPQEFQEGIRPIRSREHYGLPSRGILVGTVASLTPQKGHSVLLEAVPRIAASCPHVSFAFIGEGGLEGSLRAKVHALGMDNRVFLLGPVPALEIMGLLDIFVLPSLWEGMPVALLEAMSMERPVVATDVGGVGEAVLDGETGILIPPGDPDSIARAIVALIRNVNLRAALGKRARKRVEATFSFEKGARELEGIYLELCGFRA